MEIDPEDTENIAIASGVVEGEEDDDVDFDNCEALRSSQAMASTPDEDISQSVLLNNNNVQGAVSSNGKQTALRPCGMMLMMITEEDYNSQYWPKLRGAVSQLLSMKPGDYLPISYEQMYSCVYKCVCKQFTERLYQDLIDHVTIHLCSVNSHLQSLQSSQPTVYIESFGMSLSQFLQALGGIVPIFNYMNRFYVERTLRTDLKTVLQRLFVSTIADRHVPVLLPLLMECLSRPFVLKPPVIAQLATDLYALNPEYAKQKPHFFAKYIPNILPPLSEADLPAYIEEVRQTTRDLRSHPHFTSGDQSRKRSGDEELMAFPTPRS